MDTDNPIIHYTSRSVRGYKKCYRRLNQPNEWLQCATEIDHRVCTFRIYEDHAIQTDPRLRDGQSKYSTKERNRLMRSRNLMIKEMLTKGNPVQFRNLGDCMFPTARDKDCCLFEPVIRLSHLKVGDIVFFQIGTPGQFYAGKISALRGVG